MNIFAFLLIVQRYKYLIGLVSEIWFSDCLYNNFLKKAFISSAWNLKLVKCKFNLAIRSFVNSSFELTLVELLVGRVRKPFLKHNLETNWQQLVNLNN